MKTLQIVRQFHPSTGGMESYVSNLCRQLVMRGHSADVATLDYLFKSKTPLPPYERWENIDIIRLPSHGNARYFIAPKLLDVVPRYDLLHVHGVDFFIDLLGGLKRANSRPVVLSTHGGFFHTRWFPQFKQAYFHTITRKSLKGVDRVIACSPRDREVFSRVSDRVSLVENGIDFQSFAGVEKEIVPGRLVFVGRISRNKGLDRLIRTLAMLRRSRPDVRLVIVGPDWENLRAGLEELAARSGVSEAVTFTGPLSHDDMLVELAKAHLFVSASGYEAFGISTVEAMATSTVPVVSNIQAFMDIIDDGRTGFLAGFEDEADAAVILDSVLGLPLERIAAIGASAREAARRYDWNNVADEITGIYREVLAG
jgi:alpha-1,3-mannosyltransferase